MPRTLCLLLLCHVMCACHNTTKSPAPAPTPTVAATTPVCRVAAVNPVTRYAVCVDPRGAPVEQPPADIKVPCEHRSDADKDWNFKTRCADPQHE